jgi:CheY-like chemotaxis protein
MPLTNEFADPKAVLVVEADVIVRIALAEYLRACGFRVIEASGALEAKTVLQRGPRIDFLFADARLAGENDGFALAQWARRYRPLISIVLTGSLANKSEAAGKLCGQHHTSPPSPSLLRDRIRTMRAQQNTSPTASKRSPRARRTMTS